MSFKFAGVFEKVTRKDNRGNARDITEEAKRAFLELFSSEYLQEKLMERASGRLIGEIIEHVEKFKNYDDNGERREKPLVIEVKSDAQIKEAKFREMIHLLKQESEGSVWLLSKNLITEGMGTTPFKVFYNLDSCIKFCNFSYEDWQPSSFSFMDGYQDGYFKKVVRIDNEYYTYVAKFVKAE